LYQILASYLEQVQFPGLVPIFASAGVLLLAATVASLLPAARASRVDVIQALRNE
jgi:putative ABC transport system permease protein